MAVHTVGSGAVFYDVGKAFGANNVRQLNCDDVGKTLEGNPILQVSYEWDGKQVSYAAVMKNGQQYFIHGSGSTKYANGSTSAWQWGNTTTGRHSRGKSFHSLTGG